MTLSVSQKEFKSIKNNNTPVEGLHLKLFQIQKNKIKFDKTRNRVELGQTSSANGNIDAPENQ